MHTKIIVLTNGNYFARLILKRLVTTHSDIVAGIILITGDYKSRTGLDSYWQIGRATATPYLLYKVFTQLAFQFAQLMKPDALFSVDRLARRKLIPVHRFVSVKSEQLLALIASTQPDLVVSVSCPQLIGKKLLSSARLGGINIHSSPLPAYAGLAPYFWVLSDGEKQTATTVHFMSLKFDEGNILVQKQIPIEQDESAFHLFKRLANLGSDALNEALELALKGDSGTRQDLQGYSYYSHPTFRSYLRLRKNRHVLVRLNEVIETIKDEVHASSDDRTKANA